MAGAIDCVCNLYTSDGVQNGQTGIDPAPKPLRFVKLPGCRQARRRIRDKP